MNSAFVGFSRNITGRFGRLIKLTITRIIFGLSLAFLVYGDPCLAQVTTAISPTPPGAGGLRTIVSPSSAPGSICSGNCAITGGTRPGGGGNLFHSFGQFNIGAGDIATFQNGISFDVNGTALAAGLPTSNILARITGTNGNNPTLSAIFGTLRTSAEFRNANLFLMNPAGFLFGPNATVNVGGLVAFTSADYLRLEGTGASGMFRADATQPSVLTSAPIAAFGFLGTDPGAITVQGSQLTVTDKSSLSLVGGDVTIQAGSLENESTQSARLSAPGGHINIASVRGHGEVSMVDFSPNITMGTISIAEGALLDVSADAAGTVRIRGGELVVDNSTISADTINADAAQTAIDITVSNALSLSQKTQPALTARTSGTGNAGDIVISSGTINAAFGTDAFPSALIESHTTGSGHGGNVTISTGPLIMTGDLFAPGFFIWSGTGGDGNGGHVAITGTDVQISNTIIDTGTSFLGGFGSGGNLTVKAHSLIIDSASLGTDSQNAIGGALDLESLGLFKVTNVGFLSNFSFLGQNPVSVKADTFILENQSTFLSGTSVGDTGDFGITARIVELSNGGLIGTQTTADGRAGNIHIIASERVSLLNSPDDFTPSGIFTTSFGDLGARGDAGTITIETPRLELTNGARINSSTFTSGKGGDVTVDADSVSITGERSLPVFADVPALGELRSAGIYTRSVGGELCSGFCGDAGSVTISSTSLHLGAGGTINSDTSSNGIGGNITVNAANTVTISGTMLDGTPSNISSRSVGTEGNAGAGGDISLTAGQSLTISDGATVSADTAGSGKAGDILIKGSDVTLDSRGTITAASTGAGNAGTVTIEGLNSPANSFIANGAGSGVFTNTEDTGTGGNISVDANTLTLQNGATLSAATSGANASATGGTITINAPNAATMTNGASITASSTGPGNTGNINITAGNQFSLTNSSVTTEANQSGGGLIKITTNPNGTVQLTDSIISASVLDGNGGGGSVDIDPQYVVLQNSQIIANAVSGPGGNIFITTNLLLPDAYSTISASSQFGQQGNVTIQSPASPASGKINPLGQKPLIATSLVNQRCAALTGGNFSSFTVAGRESVPAEPGSWLSSPLALETIQEHNVAADADQLDIETTLLLSLRQLAPAGFLTQEFAVDEVAGCGS